MSIGRDYSIIAPKEQPPRKLSGKRTDNKHNTLERDLSRRWSKTLRQKYRWGKMSAMKEQYTKIHNLSVSNKLLNFVN